MKHLGSALGLFVVGTLLAACHSSNPASGDASSSGTAAVAGPAKPAASADENTWGNYLSEQGKLHGKDVGQRPYIYVIPSGDSVGATDRRKNEIDSITHSIGPVLMPGGMLIIGGPDAQQTDSFVLDLSKATKPNAMKGIVVMVVSDAVPANNDALKPTGATVRLIAM
jgi:hypothetical protein